MVLRRGKGSDAPPDDRWVRLRRELEDLPQEPVSRAHPRNWLFRTKRAMDFVGHASHARSRFFRALNPYPKPFQHVTFRASDGVQISGWLGPWETDGGPAAAEAAVLAARDDPRSLGIVIVPGMFSTKDDTVHKRRTIRMWRHWKIPVLVIDMRAFGESTGIATAGWKEALDVTAAAEILSAQTGVQRVGVIAESMGGAAALNALAYDSASGHDLLKGGVLTWSAFLDARDAVAHISERPASDNPFHSSWAGFRRLLSVRSRGAYLRFDEYLEDAARVNGLDGLDELLDLANPKWKVSMMHQPVLAVHAMDDPVVPVRHSRRLERYARDYPNIQTLVTTWGQHTGFEAMAPWWYWEVTRRFFSAVNDRELPNVVESE